ncbi:MAG: TOMM precursor leader peptide-binding protein [Rhodococcus sp. (in: high G+C Gram-positive bacteria)]|jgi:hypothetical protein|uniref:TOMM precursor leader peptide-binding protein n=1 Tax=Rhodococcoides yunnanense TaxID=278209 RepID=UPI00095B6BF8|nr:TOMM precursor leader peptide-binding protein [Rhodococcus yunnanensis]MCZ4275851.1 TOMM precursor leader peptide-binding protein [Rhodococcus yunnanensis]OLT32844.1 hypothetical protein BJF84_01880 [Rhodococcus sp. CUA-806]
MSTLPLRRPRLHAPIFVQRDGTARLGWHPERSFVVTPPPGIEPEALLDLLRRLDGVHSRAHMIWYAGTIGLSANAMSTMLAELGESGLLSEGTARASTERADETAVVTTVHVLGRGPIADAVVAGLAASPLTVIERPGAAASRTTGPDDDRSRCDIALLTDDMAPDPAVVTRLVRTRTPHLQVRLRDGRGIVGPFVLPGVSSCLRCADLFRCSADPQWPHVSAQLLGRVGEADRPTVLAAAAITLAQIEAFADGRRAPLQDTTVEIDLNDSSVSRRTWSRHPRCDCSLL